VRRGFWWNTYRLTFLFKNMNPEVLDVVAPDIVVAQEWGREHAKVRVRPEPTHVMCEGLNKQVYVIQ
jgi:hypothetical protein